jgi:hypothetical protein
VWGDAFIKKAYGRLHTEKKAMAYEGPSEEIPQGLGRGTPLPPLGEEAHTKAKG